MRNNAASSLCACALMCAVTALLAQITVPLPGVPVNLALLGVLLGGMLLGPARGALTMAAYLLLGLSGIPVFAAMRAGPAVLFGPTGGFLFGYVACAAVVGLLSRRFARTFAGACCCALIAASCCIAAGVAWFAAVGGMGRSAAAYYLPCLPGDLMKAALAAMLYLRLYAPLRAMGVIRE